MTENMPFFISPNKHIRHEVCLPSYFHNETNFQARVFIGAAEGIYDVETIFMREFIYGFVF